MFNFDPLNNIAQAILGNIIGTQPKNNNTNRSMERYKPQYNGWDNASEMPMYESGNNDRRLPPLPRHHKPNTSPKRPVHNQSIDNKRKDEKQQKIRGMSNARDNKDIQTIRKLSEEWGVPESHVKYYNVPVPYTQKYTGDIQKRKESKDKYYKKLERNEDRNSPLNLLRKPSRQMSSDRPRNQATQREDTLKYHVYDDGNRAFTASDIDRLLS